MWDFLIALSLGTGLVLCTRFIVARRKRNPRGLPLPPGLKGLPLVGNIFQFPQVKPWEVYDEMCKEHGRHSFNSGQGILILGSHQRVVDLLDKRSANYSDRPAVPIIDMADFRWAFGTMPYGTMWKQHSRTFRKYFSNSGLRQFHPVMYEETKAFLRKVKSQPDVIFKDIEFLFGVLLMRVAYGFDDDQQNEVLIHNALSLISQFTDAMSPGKLLVNYIPALRHIPSWFPGTTFKKVFREIAHLSFLTLYPPFEEARTLFVRAPFRYFSVLISHVDAASCQSLGENRRHPSIAADLIDNLPEKSDPDYATLENIARGVCAMGYVAGAETTASWATALVYCLASYPDVQAKVRAELDAVVGSDRLPLVTDREKLPYLHAVVKEVGRWHSLGPLTGAPHSNIEDDEYDGYFIPKGTIIFSNIWAIMHDPDVFDKPFEFLPERYITDGKINPSVPDSDYAAFGHGRRICPGRYFANDAVFLMAAYLVATYTIVAPKDDMGNVAPMKLESAEAAVR
ncbi:hypothetical protein MD484_g981, partial [Candolleomyces efflorescens]